MYHIDIQSALVSAYVKFAHLIFYDHWHPSYVGSIAQGAARVVQKHITQAGPRDAHIMDLKPVASGNTHDLSQAARATIHVYLDLAALLIALDSLHKGQAAH
jgi:hypothetical protein